MLTFHNEYFSNKQSKLNPKYLFLLEKINVELGFMIRVINK